ncbi:T9SS type B sorting domain-containing protein [Croceiramulus getboli]|nr:T9SS type B sorting domain-containing protein [Flavobacteriaceae bacterium YJPT1-3]
MNKKLLILCGLMLFPLVLFAQREASNWYFGYNAGLDFNSGQPVPLFDGQINTIEGCETFSTPEGNLLFYTEGRTVWNRAHEVMPNGTGLQGSFSATQSALVVPHPAIPSQYYLFTSDVVQAYQEGNGGNGINYSVIDMTRNSGLGDVITKNVNLLPRGSEKVTGVAASDGIGYWMITHYRNAFYAYRISESGLNTTPVVSTLGPVIDDFNNIHGAIKASPTGNRIAIAHTLLEPELGGRLLLYDFDNETGRVTNQTDLGQDLVYYGVEFSPDGSKLYSSAKTIQDTPLGEITAEFLIHQFDLNQLDVRSSVFTIATLDNAFASDLAGTLQLATDKKLYYSIPEASLSVIRNPNELGNAADFRPFSVSLGDRSASYGLPPFIQSFFETIVTIENFCLGQDTEFTIENADGITSVAWDFGDPASGSTNFSTAMNPTHQFSAPGVYTITLTVNYTDRPTKVFLEYVEISPSPVANPDAVLIQCDVDGVDDGISAFNLRNAIPILTTNAGNFSAFFYRTREDAENDENFINADNYTNEFNGQIVYARVFENTTCFTIVPLRLEVTPPELFDPVNLPACDVGPGTLASIVNLDQVGEDLSQLINVDELSVFRTVEDALLAINFMEGEFVIPPLENALFYYRLGTADNCLGVGQVQLEIRPSPQEEDQDVVICPAVGTVMLSLTNTYTSYNWSNGESTSSITVDQPGTYSVSIGNGLGCSQEVVFEVTTAPELDLSVDATHFEQQNSIRFSGGNESTEYSIDGGATFVARAEFRQVSPGLYQVVARDGICNEFRRTVFVQGAPNYFTPNGDGIHDVWHVTQPEFYEQLSIAIYDRYGKLMKTLSSREAGWDGTYRGAPAPSAQYWYRIQLGTQEYIGHFSLVRR